MENRTKEFTVRRTDVDVQLRVGNQHGRRSTSTRGGFLTPAVAVALVAVLVGLALVLDRWWLDNASADLTTAAESAALAAGRELVSDDLLRQKENATDSRHIEAAKQAAIRMAARNNVAGQPLRLSDGDIRFGTLTRTSGVERFTQTDDRPTTVVVTARRTRANGNPIALLLSGKSGPEAANITRRVEATVDNHIVGVRPFAGVPLPMWPIAISEADIVAETGESLPGWQSQIDQRNGADSFGYDPATKRVVQTPDGIPEITLRCGHGTTAMSGANLHLINLGTGLQVTQLEHQFASGITADELQPGEVLRIDLAPIAIDGFSAIPSSLQQRLSQQIGQCRIVLLTSQIDAPDAAGKVRVHCHRLVAGRVMEIRTTPAGQCEIVFQPGTLVTRTAVLADRALPAEQRQRFANPYIYKLQLTQ